ncbi:ethanolamine permease domain protein [Mycobacteroides abscessus]|nr:ethanolamine permease domain protein [Mycobacteroides abscessus]
MAVFGAALSYVLMMVSHIVLRISRTGDGAAVPDTRGIATSGFALVDRLCCCRGNIHCRLPTAAFATFGVFVLFMAYFGLYSRHHLVANSPDEEFAALAEAENETEIGHIMSTFRHIAGPVTYQFGSLAEVLAKAHRHGPATSSRLRCAFRRRAVPPRAGSSPRCRWRHS